MHRVFCTCHQEEMLVWGIYLSVEALLVKYKDLAIGMIQVFTIVKKTYRRYFQYFLSFESHEGEKKAL